MLDIFILLIVAAAAFWLGDPVNRGKVRAIVLRKGGGSGDDGGG